NRATRCSSYESSSSIRPQAVSAIPSASAGYGRRSTSPPYRRASPASASRCADGVSGEYEITTCPCSIACTASPSRHRLVVHAGGGGEREVGAGGRRQRVVAHLVRPARRDVRAVHDGYRIAGQARGR